AAVRKSAHSSRKSITLKQWAVGSKQWRSDFGTLGADSLCLSEITDSIFCHCSPLTAHCPLPTAHCSLLTSHMRGYIAKIPTHGGGLVVPGYLYETWLSLLSTGPRLLQLARHRFY